MPQIQYQSREHTQHNDIRRLSVNGTERKQI
jgi:hypothetical protein